MSNMKDYMMWLDDNNVAKWDMTIGELIIPDGVDVYDAETVARYNADSKWHGVERKTEIELDDDDFIIEDEEELIIDDGDMDDCAYSPDGQWFRPDGGLTGEAYEFLATTDSQGDFI